MGTFGSVQWWIDTLARPEGLKEGFNKLVSNATLMPWRRPASDGNEWRSYLTTVNRISVGPSILSRREAKGKARAIDVNEHDHDSDQGDGQGRDETGEPRRRPWAWGDPADAELWMIDVSYAHSITTCDGYKEWETRIDRSKDPYADPRLRIKDDILTRRTYLNRARNLEGEVNGARSPGFDIYGLAFRHGCIINRHNDEVEPFEPPPNPACYCPTYHSYLGARRQATEWHYDELGPDWEIRIPPEPFRPPRSPVARFVEMNAEDPVAREWRERQIDRNVREPRLHPVPRMSGKGYLRKGNSTIRFNTVIFVHGDCGIDDNDENGGDGTGPSSRQVDPRWITPFDIYEPHLDHLAPGSFRRPVASPMRAQEQADTRTERQRRRRKRYRSFNTHRIHHVRIARKALESGLFLREVMEVDDTVAKLLAVQSDWTSERERAFKAVLANAGYTAKTIRPKLKSTTSASAPPPVNEPATLWGKIGETIKKSVSRVSMHAAPPTPALSSGSDETDDADSSDSEATEYDMVSGAAWFESYASK